MSSRGFPISANPPFLFTITSRKSLNLGEYDKIWGTMDKPLRLLDPVEQQEEYEANYRNGYAAYIDGEPITGSNGAPAWREGWQHAKQEATSERSIGDLELRDENLADFDIGFQARLDNLARDPLQTPAWQQGWDSADQDDRQENSSSD